MPPFFLTFSSMSPCGLSLIVAFFSLASQLSISGFLFFSRLFSISQVSSKRISIFGAAQTRTHKYIHTPSSNRAVFFFLFSFLSNARFDGSVLAFPSLFFSTLLVGVAPHTYQRKKRLRSFDVFFFSFTILLLLISLLFPFSLPRERKGGKK